VKRYRNSPDVTLVMRSGQPGEVMAPRPRPAGAVRTKKEVPQPLVTSLSLLNAWLLTRGIEISIRCSASGEGKRTTGEWSTG